MGWRPHHKLDGVNALCGAVGNFAMECGHREGGDSWCPPPSPLSEMARRAFFVGRGPARKLKRFRRMMPQPFRGKCVAVWHAMINVMEVRPLLRGQIKIPLVELQKKTGLPPWTISRILTASREAGLLELLKPARRGRKGVRGEAALRRVSNAFINALSATLRKKLRADGIYMAAKPVKKYALEATPPPEKSRKLPIAEPPPRERTGGISSIGDVMRKLGWGK